MCGIAGYSLRLDRARSDARCAGSPRRDRRARRGRRRVRVPRAGRAYPTVVKQRTPASQLLERIAVPSARIELLVHVRDYTKGHPSIAGQQPPRPARPGRRDPQRDHRQRRRAARRARLRPRRAEDDRRLRGDLREVAPLRKRSAALEHLRRRDGSRLARRARARAWSSSPAASAGRSGSARTRRGLLRLDEGRARGRRALLRLEAPQARGAARDAARVRRTGQVVRRERFRPDREYVEPDPLPAVRAPSRSASSA